jgi:hypothetical protein
MGILICMYNQEEDVKIYDEVTEDQYKSIVKGRLQRDDFVVDDGVEGYMDNGMDDWADVDGSESEEEVNTRHKRIGRPIGCAGFGVWGSVMGLPALACTRRESPQMATSAQDKKLRLEKLAELKRAR